MAGKGSLKKALWPTTRCVICGGSSEERYPGLCCRCLERMVANRSKERFCSRCGSFYPKVLRSCPHCFLKTSAFPKDSLFAGMPYDRDNAVLVKKLKYGNRRDLGETMVRLFLRFGELTGEFDAVTAVPIHKNRLKQRGYNQSAVLARLLAEELTLPYGEVICRVHDAVSQTGLDYRERLKNPIGAFMVKDGVDLTGLRLLLVDDVLTTGATAKECVRALKSGGAKKVAVAAFAAGVSREGR